MRVVASACRNGVSVIVTVKVIYPGAIMNVP
jgi:hypothetical protein